MPPRPVHNDGIALKTVYVQVLPPLENKWTHHILFFLAGISFQCRHKWHKTNSSFAIISAISMRRLLFLSSGVFFLFCPEDGGNSFIRNILKFWEDSMVLQRATVALSVKRLATAWTVRGSNRSEGEIFRTRPGAHPSSYIMGTG